MYLNETKWQQQKKEEGGRISGILKMHQANMLP